jgi:membrane protein CcdC involved in cytochrome C biogenesis
MIVYHHFLTSSVIDMSKLLPILIRLSQNRPKSSKHNILPNVLLIDSEFLYCIDLVWIALYADTIVTKNLWLILCDMSIVKDKDNMALKSILMLNWQGKDDVLHDVHQCGWGQ